MVHHIDGCKLNNKAANLMYVTQRQNQIYARERESNEYSAAIRSKPVEGRLFSSEGPWQTYQSGHEAARRLGLPQSTISVCCRGLKNFVKSKTGTAYAFRFASNAAPGLLPGEVWRDAQDPTTGEKLGNWQVSSVGRVKTSNGIIHWGGCTDSGYLIVGFRGKHYFLVHRLVARAFRGPALLRRESRRCII